MPGPIETEIKLRMPDAQMARQAVRDLGARLVRPRHFEENLVLDDRSASLSAAGELLRLRRTDTGGVLTFKGRRADVDGLKRRAELEAAVPSPDALEAVLRALGYGTVFRYQKYRETWQWEDVEIVVDETPLGTFLEVEGPPDGIHRAAAALGRGPEDYISDSYAALFFASGGTGDMVFP